MYEGKQVVRFVNNYKSKDLYKIGNEMINRIGTGNYDLERTKFNINYKTINTKNLYQEVKSLLNNRGIEYLNKSKTNMLNGVTFTSGPEFFKSLGLPFKNSNRLYQSGDNKGQIILIPNIKSKEDIPESVIKYFDSCMEYLENLVGTENIVMASVHFDEDTPHLQAYFLPIVNEVKRKSFKRDINRELIKEIVLDINGKEKSVPILLRDSNNNIIYESVKGKFLNNDQFWKNKGGKNSFSIIQDSFNKFINNKGFKLDRGEIGSNKIHQDKLDYKINELKAEMEDLYDDIANCQERLKKSKETLINDVSNNINIKKNFTGYNSKDVDKLIDYSKNLEQLNKITNNELEIKKAINVISDALDIKLNRKPTNYISDYIKLSKEIINANKHINNEMNKSAEEFKKLFNQEI